MTSCNHPKHISKLLEGSTLFAKLLYKYNQLANIKTLTYKFLPSYLSKNVVVANLSDNGGLVLVTNNPSFKYQLNFLKAELLSYLRSCSIELAEISYINIKIDYLLTDSHLYDLAPTGMVVNSKLSWKMSSHNAILVNQLIENEIIDLGLKKGLRKLMEQIKK